MKTLPKRDEIPAQHTWDLAQIYEDDAAWENDFKKIEAQIGGFEAFVGQLEHAQTLLECLQHRDDTGKTIGKLYSYASLKRAQDNGNSHSQSSYDRILGLWSRRSAAIAWIEPEILGIESEKLAQMSRDLPDLQLYDYYFQTLERVRPHTRSSEVEEVLAQLSETRGACEQAFRMLNNADLKFPEIEDENGQSVQITHGNYINFLQSPNRSVREAAFRAVHGTFEKWKNTTATTLAGTVKSHVAMARIRKYPSVLHMELSPDAIPVEVYTNLISTVRERLPVLHRYLKLRKKLLGLETLQMWDLYVPMVKNIERELPYETGKQLVLDAALPLGAQVQDVLRRGFESRWVDVYENEGKTSGAFSNGSYLTPPFILMNYQDKLESVFTLAHEWGHSLHSFLAREAQPFVYAGYTIFVAEVASTLLEALLAHKMLEEARAAGDVPLQIYLLNQTAERFRTTLFRQTLFAEFELKIHEKIENNEALTADSMSEIYLGINRDYYGAQVEVDEVAAIEWARIPHFYYGYYVYQYATGISAAQTLARQILREGESAVTRYLDFLRGGGSKTSIDLLRGAGVDMTTPDAIHTAIDGFEEAVAEMERLSA